MVVVATLGGFTCHEWPAGRRVYAVGGNELASRFSGVRVEQVKLGVYVISGLTAGIARCWRSAITEERPRVTGRLRTQRYCGRRRGGASLAGGKGSALGALLGACHPDHQHRYHHPEHRPELQQASSSALRHCGGCVGPR